MDKFYKLLADDLVHNWFTYKEGLNVDLLKFNPSGQCQPGGLYFTQLRYLDLWSNKHWTKIAAVTLPPDAQLYPEPCGTKWKADRLVLSDIRPLHEFLAELDETSLLEMLSGHHSLKTQFLIRHIRAPSEAVCCAAIQLNVRALKYIEEPSTAVLKYAVALDYRALHWVPWHLETDELCKLAIEQDFDAVWMVGQPSAPLRDFTLSKYPDKEGLLPNLWYLM